MGLRKEPQREARPAHAVRAARAVAVEIGFDAARAIELEGTGGRWHISKRGLAPVSPSWWDDLRASREQMAQAVRSALAAAGISTRAVVTALPRRLVTLKHARLPAAPPEQIAAMVSFEAQQYIPFPLDEVVVDHQITSEEGEEMTTVLIAAARRTLVEDYLAIFDRAGVEVSRLSVSTLGLAEHAQDAAVPVGLVGVDSGQVDMAVVVAGRLLFARAALLNGSGESALPAEVARSLVAYQTAFRAQPVSRLALAGAPEAVARAEQALCDSDAVPVGRLVGGIVPAADPDALGYATVGGLALQAAGIGVGRINLVPASRTEKKHASRKRLQMMIAAAVLVPCLAVGGVAVQRVVQAQQAEAAQAAVWNGRLKTAQGALKTAKSEHDRVDRSWKTVSCGLGRGWPAVEALRVVSAAVPKGRDIYLAQLAFERGGAVVIHGFSRNERAILDFNDALDRSGAFPPGGVRLGYLGDAQSEGNMTLGAGALAARPKPGEKMSFTITCRFAKPEPVGGRTATGRRSTDQPSSQGDTEAQP